MALTCPLDPYDSRIKDASGQVRSSGEDPLRVASTRLKQSSHTSRHYVGLFGILE